ncbi:MAG: hypothetical protein KDD60_11460, partial [Bdellovibrionales bacterium]|nr:hypothetical protein [Bdellovibrionales bacterium]
MEFMKGERAVGSDLVSTSGRMNSQDAERSCSGPQFEGGGGQEASSTRIQQELGVASGDWLAYVDAEGYHLHLWAVSDPFRGSILKLHPFTLTDSVTGILRFYNSKGECVNECTIASHPGQPISLDLDSFLVGCDTDSGMRHAHVEVVSATPCFGNLHISTSVRSVILPPFHRLASPSSVQGLNGVAAQGGWSRESRDSAVRILPLSLSAEFNHVIAVVNLGDRQGTVRCKLYVDTRTPEQVCLIPPGGVV